jgi:hypothetical protein
LPTSIYFRRDSHLILSHHNSHLLLTYLLSRYFYTVKLSTQAKQSTQHQRNHVFFPSRFFVQGSRSRQVFPRLIVPPRWFIPGGSWPPVFVIWLHPGLRTGDFSTSNRLASPLSARLGWLPAWSASHQRVFAPFVGFWLPLPPLGCS